jgi:hypothetical protein
MQSVCKSISTLWKPPWFYNCYAFCRLRRLLEKQTAEIQFLEGAYSFPNPLKLKA